MHETFVMNKTDYLKPDSNSLKNYKDIKNNSL